MIQSEKPPDSQRSRGERNMAAPHENTKAEVEAAQMAQAITPACDVHKTPPGKGGCPHCGSPIAAAETDRQEEELRKKWETDRREELRGKWKWVHEIFIVIVTIAALIWVLWVVRWLR
jgi:hypothetical protein